MALKNVLQILPKQKLIIDSSLVLYIDTYNFNSFSSGRTNITNLNSGLNLTGNLFGPTLPIFSGTNAGGVISFTSTTGTQGIRYGVPSSLQITVGTASAWVRPTNTNTGFRGIMAKRDQWGLFIYNNQLVTYDWGNTQIRNTFQTIGNNNWCNVAMTFTQTTGTPSNNAIIYLNGISVLTATVKNLSYIRNFDICNADFPNFNPNQGMVGDLSQAMVYNRVLTPSEILQNFNATKSRYGL